MGWLDVQCHGQDTRGPLASDLPDEEYGPPQPDSQRIQAVGTEGHPEAGQGEAAGRQTEAAGRQAEAVGQYAAADEAAAAAATAATYIPTATAVHRCLLHPHQHPQLWPPLLQCLKFVSDLRLDNVSTL